MEVATTVDPLGVDHKAPLDPTDPADSSESKELVVPTVSKAINMEVAAGSVKTLLTRFVDSCGDMDELKHACTALSQRLVDTVTELQGREASNSLPTSDVLAQFPELLAKCLAYHERFADKPLVTRLTQHAKRLDQLKTLHQELDAFRAACRLLTTSWSVDDTEVLRLLGDAAANDDRVLAGLDDARAQLEALSQLKYYLDLSAPDDELTKLLKKVSTTIGQEASTVVATLPPWYVPADDVAFDDEPFAQGSFGSVHHGTWHARGGPEQRVVVKRLLVKTGMSEIVTERFIDEVSIWHKLDHPNVLKLLGASHVSSPPFFVCQRATHDNMAVYLASSPRSRRRMWQLLFGAAQGLAHIHKNYIVHGDLKLNNILVAQGDTDVVACVGDFGLSFVRPSAQAVQPVSDVDTARPRGGGLRWRSPESLKKRPTFASDIYSLAMCIIEAATGEPPYAALDDEHVHKELKEGNIPPRPTQLTDDAWVLVQAMAQFEPSGRLSLAEVLKVLEDFASVEKAENQELDKQDEVLAQAETRAVEPPSSPRGRRNTGSTPGAGIVPLVQLLRAGTPDQMHYAAHTLGDLAADTEANRRDVVKAGGVPLLADMVLHSTSEILKDEASRVLQLLASEGDTCVLIASAGCTALLLPLLHTGSTQQKNAVAFSLSTFLSGDASNSVQIQVDASAIRSLVELLGTGDEGQKLYAARALSNLASSHATHELITSATVIAPLLKLVQSGNDEQSLYALKALGALASQPGVCEIMADLHGVAALVAQLHTLGEDHQQYALTALSHLAKASHANCVAIAEADGVAPLVTLLGGEPGELQRLAGVVVRRMTKSNKRLCGSLVDAGVVPPLAEILRSGEPREAKSAAKTLGQVAKLHATSGRAMSDAGAVPPLVAMLQHGDDKHKSVAETTLTALLQDEESCLAIAEHGGYAIVFDMLQRGTDAQKRAAVFAIAVSFAVDSDPASQATVRRLEPLIGFLRHGTDTQKALALRVFGQLASIGMNRPSLVAAGIAAPLVALVQAKKTSSTLRMAATAVLGQLATEDDGAASIVAHGGIDAVAALLLGGESAAHEAEAALTLAHLAHEPTHCAAIAALDVVATTMQLLQKGTLVQQERAAFLLARLTQDASVHEVLTASGGLALLESLLVQADASTALQEHAAMALAGVLASPQELEAVTRLELLTALVELLDRGNDGAKLGAAASLAHVARQHPERMEKFLLSPTGTRMVPLLLALLRTGVGGQREHAALALGVCAALSDSVQQSIVATGGIDVLARQLQTSAIAQALPLLRALAPVAAHAQAFQSAKVVSLLAGVAASDSASTKHKLAAVDTVRALPSLLPTEATEAIAMAQLLLRSDESAEHEAGAALLLQLVGSHAKLVAQRGAATELVAVLQRAKGSSSTAKVDALHVLLALVDDKDALKTAGAVDAVVALLSNDGAETEATTAAVERLAVALARNKLMARDVVDKCLLPRLEQTAASGASGPRLELAREAIASFKSKRSSFSLGGRARSMSSEQSTAKE